MPAFLDPHPEWSLVMPPRKVTRVLTNNLEAGQANVTEVGKALGPTGVNIQEFRKQ